MKRTFPRRGSRRGRRRGGPVKTTSNRQKSGNYGSRKRPRRNGREEEFHFADSGSEGTKSSLEHYNETPSVQDSKYQCQGCYQNIDVMSRRCSYCGFLNPNYRSISVANALPTESCTDSIETEISQQATGKTANNRIFERNVPYSNIQLRRSRGGDTRQITHKRFPTERPFRNLERQESKNSLHVDDSGDFYTSPQKPRVYETEDGEFRRRKARDRDSSSRLMNRSSTRSVSLSTHSSQSRSVSHEKAESEPVSTKRTSRWGDRIDMSIAPNQNSIKREESKTSKIKSTTPSGDSFNESRNCTSEHSTAHLKQQSFRTEKKMPDQLGSMEQPLKHNTKLDKNEPIRSEVGILLSSKSEVKQLPITTNREVPGTNNIKRNDILPSKEVTISKQASAISPGTTPINKTSADNFMKKVYNAMQGILAKKAKNKPKTLETKLSNKCLVNKSDQSDISDGFSKKSDRPLLSSNKHKPAENKLNSKDHTLSDTIKTAVTQMKKNIHGREEAKVAQVLKPTILRTRGTTSTKQRLKQTIKSSEDKKSFGKPKLLSTNPNKDANVNKKLERSDKSIKVPFNGAAEMCSRSALSLNRNIVLRTKEPSKLEQAETVGQTNTQAIPVEKPQGTSKANADDTLISNHSNDDTNIKCIQPNMTSRYRKIRESKQDQGFAFPKNTFLPPKSVGSSRIKTHDINKAKFIRSTSLPAGKLHQIESGTTTFPQCRAENQVEKISSTISKKNDVVPVVVSGLNVNPSLQKQAAKKVKWNLSGLIQTKHTVNNTEKDDFVDAHPVVQAMPIANSCVNQPDKKQVKSCKGKFQRGKTESPEPAGFPKTTQVLNNIKNDILFAIELHEKTVLGTTVSFIVSNFVTKKNKSNQLENKFSKFSALMLQQFYGKKSTESETTPTLDSSTSSKNEIFVQPVETRNYKQNTIQTSSEGITSKNTPETVDLTNIMDQDSTPSSPTAKPKSRFVPKPSIKPTAAELSEKTIFSEKANSPAQQQTNSKRKIETAAKASSHSSVKKPRHNSDKAIPGKVVKKSKLGVDDILRNAVEDPDLRRKRLTAQQEQDFQEARQRMVYRKETEKLRKSKNLSLFKTVAGANKFYEFQPVFAHLTPDPFASARDPFKILGMPRDAPESQCKKQYKNLALLLHPDKNKHPQAVKLLHIFQGAYKQIGR